jgi:Mg-chelatase subunit ChlD
MDFKDGGPEDQPDEGPSAHSGVLHSSLETKTSQGGSSSEKSSRSSQGLTSIVAAQNAYLGEPWRGEIAPESGNLPRVLRDSLCDSESTKDREDAKRLANRIVLSAPRRRGLSKSKRGKLQPMPYADAASELDLERTLETMLAHGGLAAGDFMVRDRSEQRRAYVLVLDASGSMRGESILRALVVLAAFARTVSRSDQSIIIFDTRATILKPLRQKAHLAQLMDEMFKVRAHGMTDIAAGLQAGLQELSKSRASKRAGIIFTDGAHNMHSDPFAVAMRYPQLHVVAVKSPTLSAERVCAKLARLGRGRYASVDDPREIPIKLRSLLV